MDNGKASWEKQTRSASQRAESGCPVASQDQHPSAGWGDLEIPEEWGLPRNDGT